MVAMQQQRSFKASTFSQTYKDVSVSIRIVSRSQRRLHLHALYAL